MASASLFLALPVVPLDLACPAILVGFVFALGLMILDVPLSPFSVEPGSLFMRSCSFWPRILMWAWYALLHPACRLIALDLFAAWTSCAWPPTVPGSSPWCSLFGPAPLPLLGSPGLFWASSLIWLGVLLFWTCLLADFSVEPWFFALAPLDGLPLVSARGLLVWI